MIKTFSFSLNSITSYLKYVCQYVYSTIMKEKDSYVEQSDYSDL